MKKYIMFTCIMVMALIACHKPEPNKDTSEIVVKKYLAKTYISNPDQPEKIIEWDEGFNRIQRIVTKPGNPSYEIDYNFEYYGYDSLRVVISLPEHSFYWYMNFTNYICHLHEGKILAVDYYFDTIFQYSENYNYDNQGRLISIITNEEHLPRANYFEWEGENVVEHRCVVEGDVTSALHYDNFCEHIHPEYTLPYFLRGHIASEGSFLTCPLWKNWRRWEGDSITCMHEFDEDGYVVLSYFVNIEGDTLPHTHYIYLK